MKPLLLRTDAYIIKPKHKNSTSSCSSAKSTSTEEECIQTKSKSVNSMPSVSKPYCAMLKHLLQIKQANHGFLYSHKIKEENRTRMVEWIYEIVQKCDLSLDSLFHSIQIMDRYYKFTQEKSQIPIKDDLHIIGVTSLFIANKYNDYKNLTTNFIRKYILHGKYEEDAILDKEIEIVQALDFNLGQPNERTFIGLYSLFLEDSMTPLMKEKMEDQSIKNLGSYILSQCDPALLAAGTVFLSLPGKAHELAELCKVSVASIKSMSIKILEESAVVD